MTCARRLVARLVARPVHRRTARAVAALGAVALVSPLVVAAGAAPALAAECGDPSRPFVATPVSDGVALGPRAARVLTLRATTVAACPVSTVTAVLRPAREATTVELRPAAAVDGTVTWTGSVVIDPQRLTNADAGSWRVAYRARSGAAVTEVTGRAPVLRRSRLSFNAGSEPVRGNVLHYTGRVERASWTRRTWVPWSGGLVWISVGRPSDPGRAKIAFPRGASDGTYRVAERYRGPGTYFATTGATSTTATAVSRRDRVTSPARGTVPVAAEPAPLGDPEISGGDPCLTTARLPTLGTPQARASVGTTRAVRLRLGVWVARECGVTGVTAVLTPPRKAATTYSLTRSDLDERDQWTTGVTVDPTTLRNADAGAWPLTYTVRTARGELRIETVAVVVRASRTSFNAGPEPVRHANADLAYRGTVERASWTSRRYVVWGGATVLVSAWLGNQENAPSIAYPRTARDGTFFVSERFRGPGEYSASVFSSPTTDGSTSRTDVVGRPTRN